MPLPEQTDLEKFIHDQLQKLPEREAPAELVANVMAAIATRESLPWWKQPFTYWPRNGQMVLFGALASLFVAAVYLAWQPAESVALPNLVERASSLAWIGRTLHSLGDSLFVIVRNLPVQIFVGVAMVFCVFYASCLATGVALYKVAAEPRSRPI